MRPAINAKHEINIRQSQYEASGWSKGLGYSVGSIHAYAVDDVI